MQTVLLFLTPTLIWGSTWYAITFQLHADYPDPLWSLCWRFGFAALVLFLWCRWRFESLSFPLRTHGFFLLQGLTLFGINYWLFYEMERYVPSAFAAVTFSMIVILNSINGALFLKTPINSTTIIGGMLGIIGIVLMFWHDVVDNFDSTGLWALALGVAATYIASIGNITAVRNKKHGIPIAVINTWAMFYSAIVMALLALILQKPIMFSLDTPYLVSLLYLSIFGTVIAFGTYITLLARIGADRAAYVALLGPVIALIISSFFEDFHWTLFHILGISCIFIGNMLVFGKKRH